jgi:hypothetical protein
MIYLLIFVLFLLAVNYYAFSYGLFLVRKEKNRLAGFGIFLIVLICFLVPAYMILHYY